MRKSVKIISVILMALVMIVTFSQFVYALEVNVQPDTTGINQEGMEAMAGKVLGLIQVAAAILAVVLIAVFGFKFILGKKKKKADYQKSFIPLIVGLIVVFAATSIFKLLMGITTTS